MHIFMTGGTGLIGKEFIDYCQLNNPEHRFTVLTRSQAGNSGTVSYINRIEDINADVVIDAVINLAGEPIAASRWTQKRKQVLLDSRVALTSKLVNHFMQQGLEIPVWINASATGWYGDQGKVTVTEDTPAHQEFTHELCDAWEQAAAAAADLSARVCIMRLGLVLSPAGGFLGQLLSLFKLGLGGRFGDGEQYMPWVHIDDVIAVIQYLLHDAESTGTFNVTAPVPVTNSEFSHILGEVLGRPVFLFTPAFGLRLLLGEMARLVLTGQRVLPGRLQGQGFQFKHEYLANALAAVINSSKR